MGSEAPIDWNKGVEFYGGVEEMYIHMIEHFENLSFNQSIASLYENIIKLDFEEIEKNAHSIKGAST